MACLVVWAGATALLGSYRGLWSGTEQLMVLRPRKLVFGQGNKDPEHPFAKEPNTPSPEAPGYLLVEIDASEGVEGVPDLRNCVCQRKLSPTEAQRLHT